MAFFRKIAAVIRGANEGRATAKAHRMAEAFLGERLPTFVAEDGFAKVAPMAYLASVEQMAMIYVITYATGMTIYLDSVGATREFRTRVTRNVARACICLARLQRSGIEFQSYWMRDLIVAAKKHGVDTESEPISFMHSASLLEPPIGPRTKVNEPSTLSDSTPSEPGPMAPSAKPSGGLPRGTKVAHEKYGDGIVVDSLGPDHVSVQFTGKEAPAILAIALLRIDGDQSSNDKSAAGAPHSSPQVISSTLANKQVESSSPPSKGARVSHKLYGEGTVVAILSAKSVEVQFDGDKLPTAVANLDLRLIK